MERKESSKLETFPDFTIIPSTTEALINMSSYTEFIPEDILNNPKLESEIRTRKKLSLEFSNVIKKINRSDLYTALENKTISEKEILDLFTLLNELLKQDDLNKYIVLYLPFEILPRKNIETENEELRNITEKLISSLNEAWFKLLHVHNLRVDFTDGDVPEPEYRDGPLEKVVKVAHLIPEFLRRGIITSEDINNITQNSNDSVLSDSVKDTVSKFMDMNVNLNEKESSAYESVATLANDLQKDIEGINIDEKIIGRRRWWLDLEARKNILENYSNVLSRSLKENKINVDELLQFSENNKKNEIINSLLIKALKSFILNLSKEEAVNSFEKVKKIILTIWETNTDGDVKEQVKEMLRQLNVSNVVEDSFLREINISPSELSFPYEERIRNNSGNIEAVNSIVEKIKADKELLSLIYPVSILLGSSTKGYATSSADLDIAVFVRPNISFEKRNSLQSLLQKTFDYDKIKGEVMEFWLEETDANLSIRNFRNPDTKLGDSSLAHILTGMWCGDKDSVKELFKELIPSYLNAEGKDILGVEAREVWIEEIIRDVLQYRLLHKGYEKMFPKEGSNTNEFVDNNGYFYDSGYRRLATKLFLNRVFLPNLSK